MRWRAVLSLCACLGVATAVYAHAFAPSLLVLHETPSGLVDVTWKTPRLIVMGADVRPQLPPHCRAVSAATIADSDTAVTTRWRVDCGGSGALIAARVGISGLAAANSNALIRLELADGRLLQHVVTIDAPSYVIPAVPRPRDLALSYARAGIVSIVARLDRLLFVLGLILLAPVGVPLMRTLGAFTIGHSALLAIVMFGTVALPARSVDLIVAGTLLWLATELAREPSRTFVRRFPWIVGVVFGVVHGLAFATALRDVGLPPSNAALAVLCFNVGIELGQVSIVAAALVAGAVLRTMAGSYPVWARQLSVYVMGSLGAFWCFERASTLLR